MQCWPSPLLLSTQPSFAQVCAELAQVETPVELAQCLEKLGRHGLSSANSSEPEPEGNSSGNFETLANTFRPAFERLSSRRQAGCIGGDSETDHARAYQLVAAAEQIAR